MDLANFLLARIAEDEVAAKEEQAQRDEYTPPPGAGVAYSTFWLGAGCPARVLAECEAKRRIVERAYNERGLRGELLDRILEDLASVYADHPDFDAAWRHTAGN